jgi:hypothetical protein
MGNTTQQQALASASCNPSRTLSAPHVVFPGDHQNGETPAPGWPGFLGVGARHGAACIHIPSSLPDAVRHAASRGMEPDSLRACATFELPTTTQVTFRRSSKILLVSAISATGTK